MPDEFNSWDRAQQRSTDKVPFQARGNAVKQFAGSAERNPYKQEEARDRAIFLWVMGILGVLLLLGVLVLSGVLRNGEG